MHRKLEPFGLEEIVDVWPSLTHGGGMKKGRFTEEQIAYALRQAESGTTAAVICRQLGVGRARTSPVSDVAKLEAIGRVESIDVRR